VFSGGRPWTWDFKVEAVVSNGLGQTSIFFPRVPDDEVWEVIAADVFFNAALPGTVSHLSIGTVLIDPSGAFGTLPYHSRMQGPGTPLDGANFSGAVLAALGPITLPPKFQLLGTAFTLPAGDTMTFRATWQRIRLQGRDRG